MPGNPRIQIPSFCLVLMVGASGSGKSHFARRHFAATQIVSSDGIRGILTDNEASLDVNAEAFDLVHRIVKTRLAHGRLTVVDATNVYAAKRLPILEMARIAHAPVVAFVFDFAESTTQARNAARRRVVPAHVVAEQHAHLRATIQRLEAEGVNHVYVFSTPEEAESASVGH